MLDSASAIETKNSQIDELVKVKKKNFINFLIFAQI